jgi:predicted RNase H-like HicB family nuclease
MVSFRKYLNSMDYPDSLKDIFAVLAAHREIELTVDDVHRRLPAGTKRDTVHHEMESGVKRGLIIIVESPPYDKGPGRPPKRYQLNPILWDEYVASEMTPEKVERGYAMGIKLRLEKKEDRDRMAFEGMVYCPSCGKPTHESDIFRVSGAEKDSCLTEYIQAALRQMSIETIENGSIRITVNGFKDVMATGKTEDECRNNLIEEIRKWIEIRLHKGLDIHSLES